MSLTIVSMKLEIAHQLETAEALRRMKALTAYWHDKYAVEIRWTRKSAQLTGSFLGRTLHATISVGQDAIVLAGADPGILLRRQAAAYVTGKVRHYLSSNVPARVHDRDPVARPAAA